MTRNAGMKILIVVAMLLPLITQAQVQTQNHIWTTPGGVVVDDNGDILSTPTEIQIQNLQSQILALQAIVTQLIQQLSALIQTQSITAAAPIKKYCTLNSTIIRWVNGNPYKVRLDWTYAGTVGGKMQGSMSIGGTETHVIDGMTVNVKFDDTIFPTENTIKTQSSSVESYHQYFRLYFPDGTECFTQSKDSNQA